MIRKHKTFSFHYSPSTSFSGLFFSPGNLHTATLQVACTDHRCTRRSACSAAGGWRLGATLRGVLLYAAYAKRVSVTRTRIDYCEA